MRKYVSLVAALGLIAAVSVVGIATAAGGEGSGTVKVGELELTANFNFTPKAVSKTKQTPIAITSEGEVRMADGTHPPAVREIFIEADKSGEVHTKGIPTCKSGQLQATDSTAALKACGPALIGEGKVTAEVQFKEQQPIDVNSKLLLFNGGEKGGKITLFAHAYFSNPISGAIVTTVTITKIHKGRFGTLAVAKVPQITGGAGSTVSFNLEIFKSVKGINPISAVCADGKVKARVEGKFEDGTKAETELIRACTPKG
jgi:hypothetical protein